MTRLEDKVHDYKSLSARAAEGLLDAIGCPFTQRRRAEMETEIWSLVPAAERKVNGKSNGRGHWLCKALGGTSGDYEHRSQLISWGSAVDILWERLEADLTLSTAIVLLRTAKKLPGEIAAAVAAALADYDALPNTVAQPDGKIVRKKAMKRLPSLKATGVEARRAGERTRERERDGVVISIWAELREKLGGYIAERLGDLDPRIGEEIYRDFERDLNLILEEYQDKINRTRTRAGAETKVSRRLVIDACAVLALDPPSPGKAADLGAARKQQRRLAKLYHPDANGGDESTRPQYERVMQAYERLDAYSASIGRRMSEKNGAAVVAAAGEMLEKRENDHGGRGEFGDE